MGSECGAVATRKACRRRRRLPPLLFCFEQARRVATYLYELHELVERTAVRACTSSTYLYELVRVQACTTCTREGQGLHVTVRAACSYVCTSSYERRSEPAVLVQARTQLTTINAPRGT